MYSENALSTFVEHFGTSFSLSKKSVNYFLNEIRKYLSYNIIIGAILNRWAIIIVFSIIASRVRCHVND